MRRMCIASLMIVGALLELVAQPTPPAVYVDKGVCPGEGCRYGNWKVLRNTTLYARPEDNSKPVGKTGNATTVLAETGEVHTVAGRFVVRRRHDRFVPGDVLWVYTYRGEGFFKVWFDGKFEDIELGFSPWGGSLGRRCEASSKCWGELKENLKFTWWFKIRTPDGLVGWTKEANNFDSTDG